MDSYEKMICRYNTDMDLQGRLHGTICRYAGIPVYVFCDGVEIYLKHPVTKADFKKIKWNDDDFDISSPELGYMNLLLPEKASKNRVIYVERLPVKRYRQGLCSQHLAYCKIDGVDTHGIPGYSADHWMYSQGLYDLLINKYPTLNEAFKLLEEEKMGDSECLEIAISKDTAIQKTKSGVYQVFFKCDNVGWIAPGTRQVNVKSSEMGWIISKYLQEFSWKVE